MSYTMISLNIFSGDFFSLSKAGAYYEQNCLLNNYSCKHIHNMQYITELYILHMLPHYGVDFWPVSAASETEIRELDLQSNF